MFVLLVYNLGGKVPTLSLLDNFATSTIIVSFKKVKERHLPNSLCGKGEQANVVGELKATAGVA